MLISGQSDTKGIEMGFYDVHCCVSGVALSGQTQLILLRETEKNSWAPIAAPFRSTYNRLGGVDKPDMTKPHLKNVYEAFLEWMEKNFSIPDFDSALEYMQWQKLDLDGQVISYALIDAGVYDALPEAKGDAWTLLPDSLQVPVERLIDKIDPVDMEDTDQYCSFNGNYGCLTRVESARKKFRSSPKLLTAIEANADRWRKLDE